MKPFTQRLRDAQQTNNSRLIIGIAPHIPNLPEPIYRYDQPFLPFGKAIIEATQDLACAYVFDLASYLAMSAPGAIALERTIPLVPRGVPVILDGPFMTAGYAKAAFKEAFAADAVTLRTTEPEVIAAYTQSDQHAAFIYGEKPTNAPDNVGIYGADFFEIDGMRMLYVTQPIIYAGGVAGFEEKVRAAAENYRQQSLENAT